MFCAKCGKEVPDGSVVCPFCGTKIGASGSGQIDLSNVGGMVSSFNFKAIDNLLALIGCLCTLLGSFLPVISVEFIVSVSANFFQIGGSCLLWGILFLAFSIGGAVLLIMGKDKVFFGVSIANAAVALLAVIQIMAALNESEGFGSLGFGFFVMIIGAALMLVAGIMKFRNNR